MQGTLSVLAGALTLALAISSNASAHGARPSIAECASHSAVVATPLRDLALSTGTSPLPVVLERPAHGSYWEEVEIKRAGYEVGANVMLWSEPSARAAASLMKGLLRLKPALSLPKGAPQPRWQVYRGRTAFKRMAVPGIVEQMATYSSTSGNGAQAVAEEEVIAWTFHNVTEEEQWFADGTSMEGTMGVSLDMVVDPYPVTMALFQKDTVAACAAAH